jgi:serine/threonine-protein kinase
MVKADGTAVLLDLGVAKHSELVTVTTWGVAWGTPGYMSPEQARARRGITFKSDLFSLGLVLYQASSGKHPFAFRQELIGAVKPTRLRDVAQISEHLDRIVHRLLEADPLDRPATCEEVVRELRGR